MTAHTLKEWLEIQTCNRDHLIYAALASWVLNDFENDPKRFTIKNVIDQLERTDCAATFAPSGLIYNHEVAEKAALWRDEIDDAVAEYHEQCGENPQPSSSGRTKGDAPLTIVFLVWFAVEWVARDMARIIEGNAEDGTITENIAEAA